MMFAMALSDSPVNAAVAAAQEKIRAVADLAVVEVANGLLMLMKSAGTYRERGQLAFAQIHILESRELFMSSFVTALRDRINEDIAAKSEAKPSGSATDWQSISLVDEGQIEEKISFERIGQLIAHRSESELRELDGYMSSLLRHGWADPARNPLRGSILGSALHKAIEKITEETETQKIFARELGQAMANAMPACYREIIDDLKQRAVRPSDLTMRPVDDAAPRPAALRPGAAGAGFEEARKAWEQSWIGRMGSETGPPLRSWENSILGRRADVEPSARRRRSIRESSAALLDRLIRGGMPGSLGAPGGARAPAAAEADAELMNLLRRLNGGASYRGEFDRLPRDTGYGSYTGEQPEDFAATTRPGVPLGSAYVQPPSTGLSGLMAANLIRAHRSELMQASRGKLDHLVIEVVSSLFDQILSDARVPPEMARQIARLQLPVLRAALTDGSFFSSRRHPVRRFINRIASLACAFDSFESGAGARAARADRRPRQGHRRGRLRSASDLRRQAVRARALRRRADPCRGPGQRRRRLPCGARSSSGACSSSSASGCARRSSRWRLPNFVRDFLSGVWSQAIVTASRRDGPEAPYPLRAETRRRRARDQHPDQALARAAQALRRRPCRR